MLANWVKELTTTTGTGTITLAGKVAGFLAFTDVLVDGEQVEYMIKSGSDREYGIGTFTASGTTLARTEVLETLVAGVLDTADGGTLTAITLAGTSNVFIAASANRILGHVGYESDFTEASSWDCADNITNWSNASSGFGAANRMMVHKGPLLVPRKITFLEYDVVVADNTATHFRMGIYTIKSGGVLGDVLYDSGDLQGTVLDATGKKSHTVTGGPLFLPAGLYGFAMVSDSTIVRFRGATNANATGPMWGVQAYNNYQRYFHYVNSVTGALPDDPTDVFGISNCPLFGWI